MKNPKPRATASDAAAREIVQYARREAMDMTEPQKGAAAVFLSYIWWGSMPLYWKLLERVPSPCAQPCPAHSRLIGNMITVLAEKNVRLMDKNRILSRRSTREKLLAYLDIQARAASSREFELPFSRQELADYLCVERSAMTVELMKLDREGLIRVRGRRITLGRRESDA